MAAHRYWRINCVRTDGGAVPAASEIEMRTSIGGSDVCTGGTASASSVFGSFVAANAFDNDINTLWAANASTGWIAYDFGSGNDQDIVEVAWRSRQSSDANQSAREADIEYSDNGTDWVKKWAWTESTSWSLAQTRSFADPLTAGDPLRYWSVTCDTSAGGPTYSIGECEMRLTVGGADETGSGTASASTSFSGSFLPAQAFDGNASTWWISSATGRQWLNYDFGSGVTKAIIEVLITTRNDSFFNQGVASGSLRSSSDGLIWNVEQEFDGLMWTSGSSNTIEIVAPDPQAALLTQNAMLVLYEEASPARLTQLATLTLYEDIPLANLTQLAALVLYDFVPCAQRWAQCWKITRRDGTVLGFTALDETVSFGGVDYLPCASLSSTAIQSSATLGEVGNQELIGIIRDDRVTAQDLAGGVYQGAEVEIWLYPWGSVDNELNLRVSKGYITTTQQGDVSYKAEVLSDGQRLQQRSLTVPFTPTCRWAFGSPECGIDLGPLTESGSVTAIVARSSRLNATKRIFVDSARVEADGYFNNGELVWLTGANAGQVAKVKANVGMQIQLWDVMLDDIEAGDTYEIVPGCDKLKATCQDTWSNYINFGGFPDVPGTDEILKTPDAKKA